MTRVQQSERAAKRKPARRRTTLQKTAVARVSVENAASSSDALDAEAELASAPREKASASKKATAKKTARKSSAKKASKSAAKKKAPVQAKKKASKRGKSTRGRQGRPIDPEDLLTSSSETLLRRWIETRREEWRDAIVERHLPDVADIARGLRARLPRSVDIDDLCNAGYSGLLRCLETFNPKKGRSFQSYLKTRVYGAMVDELRAMDWLPRLMRSRLARRDALAEQMRQTLRREPSDEELAAELGVSVKSYRRSYPTLGSHASAGFLSASDQDLERLDASIIALGARGRGPDEEVHPLTSMYHQELMSRVEELCNATEWKLVKLHYFKGLKLRDIATKLRLSPARICQIHGRVLQRLKERLREEAMSI